MSAQGADDPPPPGGGDQAPADAGEPAEQPMREDQILNAVSFLTHPKVRGASERSMKEFLIKKGLSTAEIDEAFRRVPPEEKPQPGFPPPADSEGGTDAAPPPRRSPAARPVPRHGGAPAAPQQVVVAGPPAPPAPEPYRWTQIVLGVGTLACAGYAVKGLVGPYASGAMRRMGWVPAADEPDATSKPPAEERDTKVLEDVTAAMKRQTEEIHSSLEQMRRTLEDVQEASKTPIKAGQVEGLLELKEEIQGLKSTLSSAPPSPEVHRELAEIRKMLLAQTSPERPSLNAEEVGALVPGASSKRALIPAADEPPHPQSYLDVMKMLEQGQTPPGIRTDINDKPPNPSQAPSAAAMKPRLKPWEVANGSGSQGSGGSPFSAGGGAGKSPSSSSTGGWAPPAPPTLSSSAAAGAIRGQVSRNGGGSSSQLAPTEDSSS